MNKKIDKMFKAEKVSEILSSTATSVSKTAIAAADKTKELAVKSEQAVINALDQNENGEIDIEDIIILGFKTPGIKISRGEFLKKELMKNHPKDVVEKAISTTPALAGIASNEIDIIADEVIKFERTCVSGISAALGAPGGFSMAATIPADIVQYYGYMLRATQKLLYLYGFPEIETDEAGQKFDSETMNLIILCLGTMYGVAGAKNALLLVSKALAAGVEKKLLNVALTKGMIYPIIKNIMKWFNVSLTKKIFAGFFKKAIPIVGGVIGGGITFITFKPCCDKLKESLQDTYLSNSDYISKEYEELIIDTDILEKD